MKLWIFATHKDLSLSRLEEEATKEGIDQTTVFFESLILQDGTLSLHEGAVQSSLVDIAPQDRILIRWPFDADDTSIEYNIFVHVLLMHYESQVAFDTECLKKFTPFYEDKLFQSLLFKKLAIPTPPVYFCKTREQIDSIRISYPIVLKKRVSSRSKNNFLISDSDQMNGILGEKDISDYIFQKVVDIEDDVRIVFFKNKVLGAVKRFTHVREGQRLAVKGREVFDDIPSAVIDHARAINTFLGADFVGFDVLFDKEGKYYFIEANLSPQFDKFEEATGINIAQKLIQEAV